MTLRVYLAGPDVFRPDATAWARSARELCVRHDCDALIPLDDGLASPQDIYAFNIALIRRADVVLANLNPFRGTEPDSGTCFEVGFAQALDKRVIGYVATPESITARVARLQATPLVTGPHGPVDADGWLVEDFGQPLNLMLAVPLEIVIGDLKTALTRLATR